MAGVALEGLWSPFHGCGDSVIVRNIPEPSLEGFLAQPPSAGRGGGIAAREGPELPEPRAGLGVSTTGLHRPSAP